MPGAARGNGADSVLSATGSGTNCMSPMTTATDKCSSNVLVNGIGIVRAGDQVAAHPAAGCGPDESVLTSFSSTVFINGRGAGRIGDEYTADNVITSGSGNVLIGG